MTAAVPGIRAARRLDLDADPDVSEVSEPAGGTGEPAARPGDPWATGDRTRPEPTAHC
ncbi:hypothetical protein ACFYUY_27965 [Kitasatospora sp. NPDC004745]|uniref:hypothetical protein n=1 Tax=unclassified Kitasatospora TaxID=2633591 RepID=UPI003405DB7F